MMFLKLLLNMKLIFIITTALIVNSESLNVSRIAIDRLPEEVLPMHYDIKLKLYIEEDYYNFNYVFNGESSVHIVIHKTTQNIILHAKDLLMDEETTSLVTSANVTIKPVAHTYNDMNETLVINFNDSLSPGFYILNMKFLGKLSNDSNGIFKQSYENEEGKEMWLVLTHFKPTFARRAFPCWDEPALKATFSISIKHHQNYIALSNMPARKQLEGNSKGGMLWTNFEITPIMSTYLIVFVVADYVRVSNTNEKLNVWCRSQLVPHVKYALHIAEMSEIVMTDFTTLSDIVPKIDHVIVPRYPDVTMENWGLIIYRESEIVYDKESDVTSQKFHVAKLVAHEMAHQWFGNLVSPKWWSYVWLNEGFAVFFEYYIQVIGGWYIKHDLACNFQNYAFSIDIGDIKTVTTEVNSTNDFETLFSDSIYIKAPIILRMLQHIVSHDVFRKGLIKYLHTHQFKSASPDDLWNAMQIALDESDIPHDAYRLKDVMDTWMNQKEYPVVTVTRNYYTGEAIISQECFRPFLQNVYEKEKYKWWIPISFTTQTNFNFYNTVPTYWLRPQDNNIIITGIYSEGWVIVNLQRTGYYLVNYDSSNWQKIADYLNSDEYTNIHPLNRAQIIFDSFHLLKAGEFNVTIFMDIVKYFKKELNYIPWYSIFHIIEYVHEVSKYADNLYLQHELLNALDNIMQYIGYEEELLEDDSTKFKRTAALKWACILGSYECTKIATDKLVDHLINPDMYKIAPDLKEWTYCMGMMKANASIWNKLLDEYVNKPTLEILDYLSCSENPDIIINFLNLSLSNNSVVQKEMCQQVYEFVLARHANKDAVLDYILTNFERLESRIGIDQAFDILRNKIIGNVHFAMRINKIIEFVNNYVIDIQVHTSIQQVIENRLSEIFVKFASIHRLLCTYKEV